MSDAGSKIAASFGGPDQAFFVVLDLDLKLGENEIYTVSGTYTSNQELIVTFLGSATPHQKDPPTRYPAGTGTIRFQSSTVDLRKA